MRTDLSVTISLQRTSCCVCGITFAVPERWIQERRDKGGNCYCPNGHSLIFKVSNVDRLKRELEQANRQVAEKSATILRERAEKYELQRKADKLKLRRRIYQLPRIASVARDGDGRVLKKRL
jgi:hypothetical protein